VGIGFALLGTLTGGVWSLATLYARVSSLRAALNKHIDEYREDNNRIHQRIDGKTDK